MPMLRFLGAAGTVTGSKFLLSQGDRSLLVDCGLFQGTKEVRLRNWEEPRADLARRCLWRIVDFRQKSVIRHAQVAKNGNPVLRNTAAAMLSSFGLKPSCAIRFRVFRRRSRSVPVISLRSVPSASTERSRFSNVSRELSCRAFSALSIENTHATSACGYVRSADQVLRSDNYDYVVAVFHLSFYLRSFLAAMIGFGRGAHRHEARLLNYSFPAILRFSIGCAGSANHCSCGTTLGSAGSIT